LSPSSRQMDIAPKGNWSDQSADRAAAGLRVAGERHRRTAAAILGHGGAPFGNCPLISDATGPAPPQTAPLLDLLIGDGEYPWRHLDPELPRRVDPWQPQPPRRTSAGCWHSFGGSLSCAGRRPVVMSYVERILQPGEQIRHISSIHWIVYWAGIGVTLLAAVAYWLSETRP
jgi:hypothetical protein